MKKKSYNWGIVGAFIFLISPSFITVAGLPSNTPVWILEIFGSIVSATIGFGIGFALSFLWRKFK